MTPPTLRYSSASLVECQIVHNCYFTSVTSSNYNSFSQEEESGTDEAFTAVPPMRNSIRFASGGVWFADFIADLCNCRACDDKASYFWHALCSSIFYSRRDGDIRPVGIRSDRNAAIFGPPACKVVRQNLVPSFVTLLGWL